MAEALIPCDSKDGTKHEIISLLQFSLLSHNSTSSMKKQKNPDFKLVFKVCNEKRFYTRGILRGFPIG